ncbi:MAG: hypothetical protein AAFR18_09630 [Cyanobacteria bacterium J06627_32]
MFNSNSRYYSLATATYTTAAGREVTYARRRFLPSTANMPTIAEVTVTEGDRLDLITARTLGDPEQFWQICDANNAMNPVELTAESGRRLKVAVPQLPQ